MESKLVYIDLVKNEDRSYSDRNTYIFDKTPVNYNNITAMTNEIASKLKNMGLQRGDSIKLFVQSKAYTVVIVTVVNCCLIMGIDVIFEIKYNGKNYNMPLLTVNDNHTEKFDKRYSIYINNTVLKDLI